jgi:predicted phage-related endonuclease
VYRAKFGQDRGLDPELAFIGHAEELTVGRWLRKFHPELGVIRRGFMARSVEAPWLHASFDRFLVKRGDWRPVQIKTAHQFAGADWEDDVPLAVQAQIQAELLVHGSAAAYAVGFVGGRRVHLRAIERDEEYLRDVLIPQTRAFWEGHVLAQIPPDPISSAEAASLWPGGEGEVVADAELLQLLADYRAAKHAAKTYEAGAAEYALAIQKRMRDASVLLDPGGEVLATWKPTAGSTYTATRKPGRRFQLKTPKGTATA